MSLHKEVSFETEICEHLSAKGWLCQGGDYAKYERDKALFAGDVQGFLVETLATTITLAFAFAGDAVADAVDPAELLGLDMDKLAGSSRS